MSAVSMEARGTGSPGAGVMPDMGDRNQTGPPQDFCLLLTPESSLQTREPTF